MNLAALINETDRTSDSRLRSQSIIYKLTGRNGFVELVAAEGIGDTYIRDLATATARRHRCSGSARKNGRGQAVGRGHRRAQAKASH